MAHNAYSSKLNKSDSSLYVSQNDVLSGTTVYAVVGHSQSNVLKLPILSIELIDAITGQSIMQKAVKPYNNSAASLYTYVTENFTAPCSYFDIEVLFDIY